MAIYSRGHGAVVLVRFAEVEDLERIDANTIASIKHRDLVVARHADGSVLVLHRARLTADGGPDELRVEIESLPPPNATREALVRNAIEHLKTARALLALGGAARAADATRRAIKSAGGAERHAGRLAREAAPVDAEEALIRQIGVAHRPPRRSGFGR